MPTVGSTNLQQYAYDYLKDKILSDCLLEDEIYSETKLAKEIGISRTPMRDALQRLTQEGFIDILPSKGFRLHKFTESEIIEIFQIRSAIEGFSTFLLAQQFNTDKAHQTIEKLKNILKKQEDIVANNKDVVEFADYDTLFHTTLVSFAENSAFNEMFDNLLYRIKKLAIDSLSHPGRIDNTLKEHYDILNCICEGNIQDIYKVTLTHIEAPKNLNLSDYCN